VPLCNYHAFVQKLHSYLPALQACAFVCEDSLHELEERLRLKSSSKAIMTRFPFLSTLGWNLESGRQRANAFPLIQMNTVVEVEEC
jgi:hypothetical protein